MFSYWGWYVWKKKKYMYLLVQWGQGPFLQWWSPSTMWAGPLVFSSTTTEDVWITSIRCQIDSIIFWKWNHLNKLQDSLRWFHKWIALFCRNNPEVDQAVFFTEEAFKKYSHEPSLREHLCAKAAELDPGLDLLVPPPKPPPPPAEEESVVSNSSFNSLAPGRFEWNYVTF